MSDGKKRKRTSSLDLGTNPLAFSANKRQDTGDLKRAQTLPMDFAPQMPQPKTPLQLHPSPSDRNYVPFSAPSMTPSEQLRAAKIQQRVMTMTDVKERRTAKSGTTYKRGKHYAEQQQQRLAEMQSSITRQTTRIQSVSLQKQPVTEKEFRGLASQFKDGSNKEVLDITGTNASGFYSKKHKAMIPKYVNYEGFRDKQMLSQLSEIMMHSATLDGHKPVEVQFGYAKRKDGSLDLYASANQAEMQNWLEDAMKKSVGEHIQRAADSKNKELQTVADKLLWHQEQVRARKAKLPSPLSQQQQEDFATADSIFDKFLKRDLTIVKSSDAQQAYQDVQAAASKRLPKREAKLKGMSPGSPKYKQMSGWIQNDKNIIAGLPQAIAPADQTARHAEQNIAQAIYANRRLDTDLTIPLSNPYVMAEVQGSKIRCEGCSSELGHELVNQNDNPMMGKSYPSQASNPRHKHSLNLAVNHNSVFSTGSNRPRSHSIPNIPVYVPKKSTD